MGKCFREQFKYYKRKDVLLDLSGVIDFNNQPDSQHNVNIHEGVKKFDCHKRESSPIWEESFGMKNVSEWDVYEITDKPGLIFIKNPFKCDGQRYWIIRCLEYYTRKPNKLNIDAHDIIPESEDWWIYCQRNLDSDIGRQALKKLRWVTLGYHHDWDSKEYSESSRGSFPDDLNILCSKIANELSFSNFNAEAAIINMYTFGSTLSGHTDHSEINKEAPLISFSFGQSAIFLIGGLTLEESALPILVESGDVIVMSSKSRLCYHGVPRILPAKLELWNYEIKEQASNMNSQYLVQEIIDKLQNKLIWEPFDSYISKSRINMNVRQVLNFGQKTLQI